MTCDLVAVCFDANDPARLAHFWSGLMGWETAAESQQGVVLVPSDDTGFQLRFEPTDQPKLRKNHMHFDLTSTSHDDQQQTVAKALDLGAKHIDVGQRPDEGHVVLADPEGNEFCVIEPGNKFLADCGFLGAVACDGSQQVGYFWNKVLGWPLVWDQDLETAIRSPHGGPKITWGGELPAPRTDRDRLHFEIAPTGGDAQREIERLVALGASLVGVDERDPTSTVMADPDLREFRVLLRA